MSNCFLLNLIGLNEVHYFTECVLSYFLFPLFCCFLNRHKSNLVLCLLHFNVMLLFQVNLDDLFSF